MIKASELIIGNWIQNYHSPHDLTIVNKDVFSTTDADGNIEGEGIPLTEGWLLKFGFEPNSIDLNSTTKLYVNEDEVTFIVHVADDGSGGVRLKDLQYVHQLQNLCFALTGTELTIKEPVNNIS